MFEKQYSDKISKMLSKYPCSQQKRYFNTKYKFNVINNALEKIKITFLFMQVETEAYRKADVFSFMDKHFNNHAVVLKFFMNREIISYPFWAVPSFHRLFRLWQIEITCVLKLKISNSWTEIVHLCYMCDSSVWDACIDLCYFFTEAISYCH